MNRVLTYYTEDKKFILTISKKQVVISANIMQNNHNPYKYFNELPIITKSKKESLNILYNYYNYYNLELPQLKFHTSSYSTNTQGIIKISNKWVAFYQCLYIDNLVEATSLDGNILYDILEECSSYGKTRKQALINLSIQLDQVLDKHKVNYQDKINIKKILKTV